MISSNDAPLVDDVAPKRHAACDECRTRKLKCSGEETGCRRCVKQGILCQYSVQKQMGRPPKKRKTDTLDIDGAVIPDPNPPIDIISEVEKDWSSANISAAAVHLFPQGYVGGISGHNNNGSLVSSSILEPVHRLKPISATAEPWPDFTITSASAGMLSMGYESTNVPYDMSAGISDTAPTCPCLSYLYLCLSTLSSLNSFSINRETINSLCTAARTARSVIRCEICPLNFATGLQNVMMLGTLLSVMADAWLKIAQADGGTLGRDLSSPEFQELIVSNGQDTQQTWQFWLRQVLRRAVIGVPIHEKLCQPTPACTKTPDILSLIHELEDRQRRWHSQGASQLPIPVKGPFSCTPSSSSSDAMSASAGSTPSSMSSALGEGMPTGEVEKQQDIAERDYLCLKMIGASKHVIQKFGFLPSEYPEGVEPV